MKPTQPGPRALEVQSSPLNAAEPIVVVRFCELDGSLAFLQRAEATRLCTASGASREPAERRGSVASESRVMVVAHVLALRVLEVPGHAPALDAAPAPDATQVRAPIIVELLASGAADGAAVVRLQHTQLGPIVLQISLRDGQVEVEAEVSNARAATLLRSGQGMLANNVMLQGLELRKLGVKVAVRGRKPKQASPRHGHLPSEEA
jgi:hypothetical protein